MIKHWYDKKGKGSYYDKTLMRFVDNPMHGFDDEIQIAQEATPVLIPVKKMKQEKQFWLSIKKAKDCLFSRREGWTGRRIFGYSVVIRLFSIDLLPSKLKKQFIKEAKNLQKEQP